MNTTSECDEEKNESAETNDVDESQSNLTSTSTMAPGGTYGFENDTHTYTDATDGTVYIWDNEKRAWFPKIDDDFMARYQMSYGFTDPNVEDKSEKSSVANVAKSVQVDKEQKKVEAKRKAVEPPTWFEVDSAHNTAIYISGLPLDVTMDELVELVSKCGLIARDDKNQNKVKLYRDSDGNPKGDALCTYIKVSKWKIYMSKTFLFSKRKLIYIEYLI
ncbi:hypothetical protein PV327_005778 [Microctonus hyperodae]|uniref:Uncharacterized protein n=1 Tax=Microctonus hyperodae TaxID=165561 RepID=A0AA39G2D8_MICHY|nr:hypothetical protein PV327_005778 [Microctonus hyperodae]